MLFGEYPEFRGYARAHREALAEYGEARTDPRGAAVLVARSGRMGRRIAVALSTPPAGNSAGGVDISSAANSTGDPWATGGRASSTGPGSPADPLFRRIPRAAGDCRAHPRALFT
ncbi:hypothetical protein GCM10010433_67190 [Streptomyces pulveraceus]